MALASRKRLWADHSKLANKHRNIKKHMRCLNVSELRELSQLELLSDPFN
jgi:hypothetical protein